MKTRESQSGSIQRRARLLTLSFALSLLLGSLGGRAQDIACGQTIAHTFEAPSQTNSYAFVANAGETVTLLALGQSMNAVADVYDPENRRIGGATNNFTGPINLAAKGTYTVRVHADSPASIGTYGISLSFLSGRCGATLLSGPPQSNAITTLAEVDSYTFTGNAGETVVINTAGNGFTPTAYVAGPNGAILANWVNGSATLDIASTGPYTVGIYSYYATGTGTYSLSLFYAKLVPASFRLAIGATNGAAALAIWGQAGRPTTLRYATNLAAPVQWFTLTNFNLPWSPYRFVDSASVNSPRRFYQTVQ